MRWLILIEMLRESNTTQGKSRFTEIGKQKKAKINIVIKDY